MVITAEQRLLLLAAAAVALMALGVTMIYRMRMSPAERERRRRNRLNTLGRLGDALITDIQEDTVYYSYSVSGVAYHASQDLRALRSVLPPAERLVIGQAYIKYLARNPANSIVACEHWSGLRARTGVAPAPQAGD